RSYGDWSSDVCSSDLVLQWLRLDSTGGLKSDDAAIFSNEVGEPLKTFKKAWLVAVLKAHGIDPHWRKGAYKDLTSECQQRFREIDRKSTRLNSSHRTT